MNVARTRKATLRDVAALAGVGVSTASRVVNGESGVVAEKVAAVRQAVAMLDYQPDAGARSLRRLDGRTRAIAAILEDLANPFCAEILRALEDVARENGALVLAGSVDDDVDRERGLVREFANRRADGMLLMSVSSEHGFVRNAVDGGAGPVVFVDRPPVGVAADCVAVDNREASAAAVRHLARRGHRRIAFVGERMTRPTNQDRFEGFRQALMELGLHPHPSHVAQNLRTPDQVDEAVTRMLSLPDPPTALYSGQNDITVAVVRSLQRHGRENSVALVGFDDFPMADLLRPRVTVVAQNPTAIGRTAAQILFGRLLGDDSPYRDIVIPTQLIERGSGELSPGDADETDA